MAVELITPSREASEGPAQQVNLARIYALMGLPKPALELLAPLIAVPSWISAAELRSDPTWAPLRSHSLFAQLIH
jgi:hypothetical protein